MKKPGLLELRPCQFVLGMKEVEAKIEKIQELKKRKKTKLQAYLDDHVIPVVIGPERELFIIDHHHFARTCWELGIENYSVRVMEDMSDLDAQAFWNKMVKRGWTYLHDQFGLGPHEPSSLPVDIRCLADDPYRSLAWSGIDGGWIQKETIPFFEFHWAAFFRLNLPLRLHSKSDFTQAIALASKLAVSKSADHLPGFIGKKKSKL
jgi:hypothetical protein